MLSMYQLSLLLFIVQFGKIMNLILNDNYLIVLIVIILA